MDNLIFALSFIPAIVVAALLWTELKGAGWQPAPKRSIESALALAQVGPKDVFYDLGAGDGRVLLAAAKTGARAIGVEIDPLRYLICRLNIIIASRRNASVILADLFNVPLDDATVVFAYLRGWSNDRLKQKLLALKKGTRIITYHWPIKGWTSVKKDTERDIYLYTV